MVKIIRVISGGQTGADMGGLKAARSLGIETGGFAPKRFRTERGSSNVELRDVYGLTEVIDGSYAVRTEKNVLEAHGTIIIGDVNSRGSDLTRRLCNKHNKPFMLISWPLNSVDNAITKESEYLEKLANFKQLYHVSILNVAGNRESVNPGIEEYTEQLLKKFLIPERGKIRHG